MANPFGDPGTQALLGLAQGLLAAGSPQRMPVSVGGALAQGVGGALNGAMQAQNYNLQQQKVALTGFQAAHAQYQAELQAWAANGGRGPAPVPPAFNFPGMPQPTPQATQSQSSAPAAVGGSAGMSPNTSTLAFGTPDY